MKRMKQKIFHHANFISRIAQTVLDILPMYWEFRKKGRHVFKEEEINRNRTRQGKNNKNNVIMNLVCLTKQQQPNLFSS